MVTGESQKLKPLISNSPILGIFHRWASEVQKTTFTIASHLVEIVYMQKKLPMSDPTTVVSGQDEP